MFSPFLSRFVRESSAFHCYAYRENKGDKRNTLVHRSCPQRSLVCEENRQINFGALWFHSGPLCDGTNTLPSMSMSDWRDIQLTDESISPIIKLVQDGREPTDEYLTAMKEEAKLLWRHRKKLHVQNGVLFKRCELPCGREALQLVLPNSHREETMKQLHDEMGHLGYERTHDLIRSRFYWPRMGADIEQKCTTCPRCIRRKKRAVKSALLTSIRTTSPMELVCIDFLTLEPDKSNTRNILVVNDHYTRYAQALPTKD